MMGGGWKINTGNPLIVGMNWGSMVALSYGEVGWPSQSYRLFVFEAE
jgi:hypothetical protein